MTGTIFNREAVTVQLQCGHLVNYYPVPYMGDIVYCRKCAQYCRVTFGAAERRSRGRLRVKCRVCKFARYETDTVNEERLIVKGESHSFRSGHTVDLKLGREIQRTLRRVANEDQ